MSKAIEFLKKFKKINAKGTPEKVDEKRRALLKLIEASWDPGLSYVDEESSDDEDVDCEPFITAEYSRRLHNVIKADLFLKRIFPESSSDDDQIGEVPDYIKIYQEGVNNFQDHLLKTYENIIDNDEQYMSEVSKVATENSTNVIDLLRQIKENKIELANKNVNNNRRFKAAISYEQNLKKLRELVKQEKHSNLNSPYKKVQEAPLDLTRGISEGSMVRANIVMLPDNDKWSFHIYRGTDVQLQTIPVTPVAQRPSVCFDSSPVLVGLEGNKEVIVGRRTFTIPNTSAVKASPVQEVTVFLKQELDGARVTVVTSNGQNIQDLKDDELEEIAMKQAEMLLLNYKPGRGWDQITIGEPDQAMSMRIHAALLLLIDDSPAKGLKIVNACPADLPWVSTNKSECMGRNPDKGWGWGTASKYEKFIEKHLPNQVKSYKSQKQKDTKLFTMAINELQNEKKRKKESRKSEEPYCGDEGTRLSSKK